MRVYVDLVLVLNIYLDFLIILCTSLILKRNIKIYRVVLGSIIGGLSTFILFIRVSNFSLFIFKVLFSILMVLVSFSYKNFKYFINNLIYLYLSSIVLGGGLYLLDLEININNIFLIIIFGLIIIFIYIKEELKVRNNYSNYLKVVFYYRKKKYDLVGYIDSGNKLRDQYKGRMISLMYKKDFKYDYQDIIYVPYETASGSGVIKCIKVDNLEINNENNSGLIGLMEREIKIDGVDIILNSGYIGGL